MNEYYDEEENLGLSMLEGGDEDDAEQHDTEFLCEQDGEGGEMGDDGSGWGGDDDNAGAGSGDDLFDGDYYDDGVAGGFDGGYNDDDGGDGADDWW